MPRSLALIASLLLVLLLAACNMAAQTDSSKLSMAQADAGALGRSGQLVDGLGNLPVAQAPLANAAHLAPTPTRARSTPTAAGAGEPATVPPGWQVALDSDFSDNDPGTWQVNNQDVLTTGTDNGRYNMTVKQASGFFSWATELGDWTDGYITATFEIQGPGAVGVAARIGQFDHHVIAIACNISSDTKWRCYKRQSGKDTDIVNGTNSQIKAEGLNTIGLLANGPQYTFYINDKQVTSFSDSSLTVGTLGITVETVDEEATTGSFSHIVITGPLDPTIDETPTPDPNADNTIVSTDFSQDAGSWLTGEGTGFSITADSGALVIKESQANGVVGTAPQEAAGLADGRIEATFTVSDASKTKPGLVGVSARSQAYATKYKDWSQVFCGINNTGAYSCNRVTTASNGRLNFTEVMHGKATNMEANKPNTIALTGINSRWTLEINGVKVGSFTENSLHTGAWGVLVRAGGAATTGSFSKVSIYKP